MPEPNRPRGKGWLALGAALACAIAGCVIVVAGTVPDFGTTGEGDAWSFEVFVSGETTITAVSDQADLVLELYDGAGSLLATGDDEIECDGAELSCGFRCPEIVTDLSPGTYAVVVRDFGTTTPDCPGGAYVLSVTTPGGPLAGTAIQVVDDGIVTPSRSTTEK